MRHALSLPNNTSAYIYSPHTLPFSTAPTLTCQLTSTTHSLSSTADSKLHQVVHEGLQADIVGEDGLRGLSYTSVTRRGMCRRWVELGEEETCLRTACITDDETWKWESILDEILQVCQLAI